MKKAMWALSFITLIGTVVAVQFLPENVPMHMDFEGNIDRWGSRYENLIFPVIIIIMRKKQRKQMMKRRQQRA